MSICWIKISEYVSATDSASDFLPILAQLPDPFLEYLIPFNVPIGSFNTIIPSGCFLAKS
jgi:hypothetical protein